MDTNALTLCAPTSRGFTVAYGHALSCAPEWVICVDRVRTLAPIFDTHGIAVPISRGSPPVLTE